MSRLCVVCCCCVPRRARGCEPARRGVCQRQTPPGRGEAADSGAGPPGRPALRHLQTAAGQPRLRQQDPGQVGEHSPDKPCSQVHSAGCGEVDGYARCTVVVVVVGGGGESSTYKTQLDFFFNFFF